MQKKTNKKQSKHKHHGNNPKIQHHEEELKEIKRYDNSTRQVYQKEKQTNFENKEKPNERDIAYKTRVNNPSVNFEVDQSDEK